MAAPSRIVVRAPNWVGDVVLSLPALRDLRRLHPAARLEVLARPWVGELYRAVREVDAVLESRGVAHDAAALRGRFDLGVLLPNSFAAALSAVASRHPRALGLRHRRARAAADAALPRARARPGPKPGVLLSGDARRPGARGRGPARRLARVPAGVGRSGAGPARGRGPLDRRQRRGLLRHGQALAAGALRGRGRARGAPPRRQGRDRRCCGRARRSARRLAAQLGGSARVLCGETTLAGLVGVLTRLRLLLTNDSGPMHLAAALGTPLVAVFGSTDWTRDGARLRARAGRARGHRVRALPACASARSTTAA